MQNNTMLGITRSKSDLLNEFTNVIYRYDPMGLRAPNNNEYESEALSILSRFVESGIINSTDDPQVAFNFAAGIVAQCFNFYFDELAQNLDLSDLTTELLTIYIESYQAKM